MLATLSAPRSRMSVDRTAAYLWYTVCIVPQSQPRFCQRAKELGIETYTPMSRTPPQVRKFRRQRVIGAEVRPLMPGYVFVSLSAVDPRFYLFQASAEGPEAIRGSLRLLRGPDGPMAVSEAVIEDMRLREKNGEFDLTGLSDDGRGFVAKWVKRGVRVQIIEDGPFSNALRDDRQGGRKIAGARRRDDLRPRFGSGCAGGLDAEVEVTPCAARKIMPCASAQSGVHSRTPAGSRRRRARIRSKDRGRAALGEFNKTSHNLTN